MTTGIMKVVEGVAAQVGQIFHTSLPSYCDIETADTDHSLVTSKGTLVSGIRIDGLKFAVGPEEFENTVNAITRALQSYLTNPAYTVDIFASSDAGGVGKELDSMSVQIKASCDRMNVDLSDVVDSNVRALRKHASHESIYLALWTRESVLTQREIKDHIRTRSDAMAKAPNPGQGGQNLFSSCASMRERHEATVKSVFEDLKNAGVVCYQLTAHEMLRVARREIDPEFTPDDWTPHLAGDPLTPGRGPTMLRNPDAAALDLSDVQYPRVEWQMFPRDAYRLNSKYVVIGDKAYAPVFIEIPPREVTPFGALFEKLRSANVPWRALFRIDGAGLSYMGTRNAVASLLAFTSSFNARIHEAHKALSAVEFQGITNVKVRFAFCTWAPANDTELLARRASRPQAAPRALVARLQT